MSANRKDWRWKHGGCHTPTYTTWCKMLSRCNNPNANNYARYGGKGVVVCERWQAYENFVADMGTRPVGKSLDRINSKGNYEPANCRWATAKEQNINRNTVALLEWNGRRQCVADWAREYGIKGSTLRGRIAKGWTVEDALTTPKIRRGDWHVRSRGKSVAK